MRRLIAALTVVTALLAPVVLGSGAGCAPDGLWICQNPATGKDDPNAPYDENHYVNGVFDPCHCYDPCGPAATCPILVDAGPPGPGCHAGDAGDGGT